MRGMSTGLRIAGIVTVCLLGIIIISIGLYYCKSNSNQYTKTRTIAEGMGQGGYPNPRAMPYQMNMNNSNMGMMSSQYGRGMGY